MCGMVMASQCEKRRATQMRIELGVPGSGEGLGRNRHCRVIKPRAL
jgi:hypothetical protein